MLMFNFQYNVFPQIQQNLINLSLYIHVHVYYSNYINYNAINKCGSPFYILLHKSKLKTNLPSMNI